MIEFAVALAAFLAAHSIPALPSVRGRLVALLGRVPYLAAYSVLSFVLLAWLVDAARRADTVTLWEPARWQWCVTLALMPFALFFLTSGLFAANPLSVSLRSGAKPGAIVAITRHPLIWGFLVWAVAHIPPNGDLVSVVLFGGLAAFSLAGLVLLDAKAKRRLGAERWRAMSQATSVVPFAALLTGRATIGPARALVAGAVLATAVYAWFLVQGHALLIGPDPLAMFRALD